MNSSPQVWTIHHKREVTAYLIALREAGSELRQAVQLLQLGVPEDARQLQEEPEIWEWLEARHWITIVVLDREKRWLLVADVEAVADG